METQTSDLITTTKAAEKIGVSRQRIGQLILEGDLVPVVKIGGRSLLSLAAVLAYQRRPLGRPKATPKKKKNSP